MEQVFQMLKQNLLGTYFDIFVFFPQMKIIVFTKFSFHKNIYAVVIFFSNDVSAGALCACFIICKLNANNIDIMELIWNCFKCKLTVFYISFCYQNFNLNVNNILIFS